MWRGRPIEQDANATGMEDVGGGDMGGWLNSGVKQFKKGLFVMLDIPVRRECYEIAPRVPVFVTSRCLIAQQ